MAEVDVREVGPRDGLQAEAPISVEARVKLIEALVDAGIIHIEACSFVSPKAVPAMAGAAEVMARVPRNAGLRYAALVPNLKGAEMALAAGVDELTVTVSASETYNQKNVRRSIEESVTQVAEICKLAGDVPVDGIVSFAFGSPYEEVRPEDVAALGRRVLDAGARQLTYADTNGSASPPSLERLAETTGGIDGLHLHNGRGMALVNAYAAVQLGLRRFDTSVGGLGGSPFADDAGGNLATEEFVYLLDALGQKSGIDLDALRKIALMVTEMVGRR